ncbi:MAG: DNA polymerase III subunit delta [Bacteroidaceae bacterium]|nr:DNA polymerase III subunit delta [Bacteroidaceae bacterium]
MNFSEVIGQERTKEHLRQMVREDKIPHALMFCGPSGAGKLPLALAFASYLLCERQQPALHEASLFGDMPQTDAPSEPCGQCQACRMVAEWAHPDLHFSFPVYKKKSTDATVSDDYLPQWREQLKQDVYFDTEIWLSDIKAENQQIMHYVHESDALQRKLALKASQGGRRVVVLWLPERMKVEMANKLLKLIEEPPSHTHFLLVSEDADNVLGTIQSRVQRIQVPALSEDEIRQALIERHGLQEEEAQSLARVAQGSYTEAIKRLQSGSEEQMFFDLFVQLMRLSYTRQIKPLREWSYVASDLGRERQKRMLDYWQRLLRENFIYNFHRPELTYQTKEEQSFSTRFAPFINEKNVMGMMDELSDAGRDIAQNVSARMVFFDLALKTIIYLKAAS